MIYFCGRKTFLCQQRTRKLRKRLTISITIEPDISRITTPMTLSSRRHFLGLTFLLLLSSAEAIRIRSTINTQQKSHEHETTSTMQSWTNSEISQLKGQVKSLSLHLTFLNEAVADQNVPDIKAGVKKMTQEVHNCKDTFARITEFESPNQCSSSEDENDAACVSPDLMEELRDSISNLFKDPFLDKIPDYLGVYALSEETSVVAARTKVSDILVPLQHHFQHHHHEETDTEGSKGTEMKTLNGCLSALDEELVAHEELLTPSHASEDSLVSQMSQMSVHHDSLVELGTSIREDSLVKGFMKLIVNAALVGFLFPFFVAFSLVFAVIYSVASFLGLSFITHAQDKVVHHALKKVNEALTSVVPEQGIKIGEIRRRNRHGQRELYIN